MDPARASLVEETADAARDWARSELRHAERFQQPVITNLAAAEARLAELDGVVRAVGRIMRLAPLLAERLAKNGLQSQLSPDAQKLSAQLTNSDKRHVPSSISQEQRQHAEAERTRWEGVALLQKRLARTSSHPSILFARDEDERQEAAFRLAWATLAPKTVGPL